jgi:hypothetical protein
VYDNAHELKVIIFNKHDFVLRRRTSAKVNDNAILFPAGMEAGGNDAVYCGLCYE